MARDIAHAKILERLEAGDGLPQYMLDHPVYYAGPAKTPEGYASGSFGPTTAGHGFLRRSISSCGRFEMLSQKGIVVLP